MKITFKKILLWLFWPIFACFFLGTYFLLPKDESQDHLKFIPVNVDFVVLVNPMQLFKSYANLLQENPTAFEALDLNLKEDDQEFQLKIGVDIFKKMAVFQYNQSESDFSSLSLLVQTLDFDAFVEMFNKRDNKPEFIAYSGGKILVMPKDNEIFMLKNNVAVRFLSEKFPVTEDIAKKCFDDVFEAKNHLMDYEPAFKEQILSKNQLTYWSKQGSNLASHVNPYMGMLSNIFDTKNIVVNLTEKGFEIDAVLELNDESTVIDRSSELLELQGKECFRFAASISPKQFDNFFDVVFPSNKQYLLESWNGGICAAIDGFENLSVKKIRPSDSTKLAGPDSLYPFAMVEEDLIEVKIPMVKGGIDELFSYPQFTIACELTSIENLKAAISLDADISQVGEYYSFILPGFMTVKGKKKEKQRVYFYFVENSIVFCPELKEANFHPVYTNFAMNFKFDPFFANYENKNMFGDFIINKMKDFEFNGFEIHYVKNEAGNIYLHGVFDLKNTDNHFIGFPLLLKKISEMSFLTSLPIAL